MYVYTQGKTKNRISIGDPEGARTERLSPTLRTRQTIYVLSLETMRFIKLSRIDKELLGKTPSQSLPKMPFFGVYHIRRQPMCKHFLRNKVPKVSLQHKAFTTKVHVTTIYPKAPFTKARSSYALMPNFKYFFSAHFIRKFL